MALAGNETLARILIILKKKLSIPSAGRQDPTLRRASIRETV
jgi:hypothetical protein